MQVDVKVSVIYYSSTGNIHALTEAVRAGAESQGASVRLHRVAELAPAAAIVFGSPSRYGNMAAQLKQFLDTTGARWADNALADKVASGFTSAGSVHGGQETTLTSMYHVLMHWGAIPVPPGYTDPVVESAGGNPYGVSATDGGEQGPSDASRAAARYLGQRIVEKTAPLSRPAPVPSGAQR